jgi:hypothetical protein
MMKPHSVALSLVAVAALAASSGCLSEQEREARRRYAFDLAGEYEEQREVAPGVLAIENQADKNDVKAVLTRTALYDGEQAFLDRVKDPAVREALAKGLSFGEGNDDVAQGISGGDNFSKDFGASSELHLGAASLDATPSVEGATDAKVDYAIDLRIDNGTDKLAGTLKLTFREQRPKATSEETEAHSESAEIDVAFTRKAGVIESDRCADCTGKAANEDDKSGAPTPTASTEG